MSAIGRRVTEAAIRSSGASASCSSALNKKYSKTLLNSIDIQGFYARTSFYKYLVSSIRSGRQANLITLSLTNCGIQEPEGQ